MKLFYTLFFLGTFLYSSGQRCAIQENSSQSIFRTEGFNNSGILKDGRDTISNEVIVIPVVIHVLYNNSIQNISDQQILSQIESLNNDFRRLNADTVKTPDVFKGVAADTRITFCLAKVDPKGQYTTGIIRKYTSEKQFMADDAVKFNSKGGSDAWDATRYLNIWVCNLFGRTLGYSVLPGSPAERDGVVMKYNVFGTTGTLYAPYNKGRTATHEIGHWLGLQHLWGSGVCGDDGIADTPPQQASNSGCTSFPHVSACSVNKYGDMFMNFMDFSDDACMNLFTYGQKTAIRSLFAKGGFRNSFLNSNVCIGSDAERATLPDLEDAPEAISIKIYPNPFMDKIIVSAKSDDEVNGKVLKIYGPTGILYNSQVLQGQKTIISVSQLPVGIYFARLEGNGKPMMIKLVKAAR